MSEGTLSPTGIYESEIEEICLDLLKDCGYEVIHGAKSTIDEAGISRENYQDVVLVGRLRDALTRINDKIPIDAIEQAIRQVTHLNTNNLIVNNHNFHKLLTEGVDVSYHNGDRIIYNKVWLVDFSRPEQNDWLAINQFTVKENRKLRRPDVILFVNGLPLGLIELKSFAKRDADVEKAFIQIQNYKKDIPTLLSYNEILIISDGMETLAGSLTANRERFNPWRSAEGDDLSPTKGELEMETLIKGICEKSRFLDIIQNFIVFEADGDETRKIMAAYHQFHASNKALESTLKATSPTGDKKVGVVWHTQGSGKSLSMVFYAGKVIRHPAMANPTIVVLTDRNDLDDQLFSTFSKCSELLRQSPVQAISRADLEDLLQVASGGIVFTTIQKFFPDEKGKKYKKLSDRRNIVVIADEAHRSQYDFIDGFARHMRDALENASFIGFTGTPIESGDRSTPQVFGNYLDTYDIQQAVEDGATVPIYYEAHLAKVMLDEEARKYIDQDIDEVTEGEEVVQKERRKSKWSRLEAIVGAEGRIKEVAEDIVKHFEKRSLALNGKAMVVCMSRRICVDLYKAIIALRPQWHSDKLEEGTIKVIMTSSADDPPEFQIHRRSKSENQALASRFRDEGNSLRLVIVRDMWLTGFDAPSVHTMYVDKYMKGHGLMQAIARVNRVFADKPGGLVVDYLGLAEHLKRAMANYVASSGRGKPFLDQDLAVEKLKQEHEILQNIMNGFDYSKWRNVLGKERLLVVREALDFIIGHKEGEEFQKRFKDAVVRLSQAFALSVPNPTTDELRDDVSFFQTVNSALNKKSPSGKSKRTKDEAMDVAIRQLVSQSIAPDGVVDIYSAAGLQRPDISLLSDEFLDDVRELPQKNLAFEALKRLLEDSIKSRSRKNIIEARAFSKMLEKAILRYQNRTVAAAEVINELIQMAKEIRAADEEGKKLGLSEDERAFYSALKGDGNIVDDWSDEKIKAIARDLVWAVKENATIDWTLKESIQAKLRVIVKRLLRKHGYPPEKQEKATETVLEQANLLADDWVTEI